MNTAALKEEAASAIASGKFAEAIEAYKRVLKEDKNDLDACVKLAELYVKTGQRQHAVKFYEVAAKRYAAKGVLPKAVAISKIVLRLDPSKKEIEELLTKLYAKKDGVTAGAPSTVAKLPPPPPPPPPEPDPEPVFELEEAVETEEEVMLLEELEDDEVVEGFVDGPAMDALMAQLPKVPIFSDLAPQEFSWFVHGMEVKLYEPGEAVVVEGEPGDAFYIITAGRAKVMKRGPDGKDVQLAVLVDGAFFGEFAYLAGTRRTASVIAETPLELLQITREHLDGLVADFPQVKTVMERFLHDRMMQTIMTVSPLFTRLKAPERAAIAAKLRLVEVAAGKTVIREQDEAKGFFVIAYGGVTVSMKNDFGGEEEIAVLQVGDFFGEMALLSNQKTSAKVTTNDKSAFFVLTKEDFQALLKQSTTFAVILKEIAEKRAKQNEEIRDSLMQLGEQGLV